MFDLLSFIRQLLPPHRRNPITVALVQILFGGCRRVMDGLVALRADLLDQVRVTGQTLVLENLLTRAVAKYSNGTAYIAEGTSPSLDFLVIVPADVPDSGYGELRTILDRYKLTGKRYDLAKSLIYTSGDASGALAWAPGYPYLKDNIIYMAINKLGTYAVRVVADDGRVYADTNVVFLNGTTSQTTVDAGKRYTVSVGSLTATVSYDRGQLSNVVGYDWNADNNSTLFVGFNGSEPPVVTLYLPDGTTQTQTAIAFGVTFAGTAFAYRAMFAGLTANGSYNIDATAKNARVQGYVILTRTNSGQDFVTTSIVTNKPPIVSRKVSSQTATAGVAYSQTLPSDTFYDADGTIASVVVEADSLPAGLTATVASDLSVAITGTPTTAQTKTIRVKATDNGGAFCYLEYAIVVAASTGNNSGGNPAPVLGTDQIIVANPAVLNPKVEWSNGRARVVNQASPAVGAGEMLMYFIGGQPPLLSLPTTYDYLPGDEVTIYLAIGSSPNIYITQWSANSYSQIVFGQAPTV